MSFRENPRVERIKPEEVQFILTIDRDKFDEDHTARDIIIISIITGLVTCLVSAMM